MDWIKEAVLRYLVKNWKTTVIGIVGGLAAYYGKSKGFEIPTDVVDKVAAGAIALIGILAGDALKEE